MPTKSGTTEDDELMAMLWGNAGHGVSGGQGASDDENAAPAKKRKTAGRSNTRQAAADSSSSRPAATSQPSDAASSADAPAGVFSWKLSGGGKKNAAESRELDKSESLILQANQLKLQLEDSRQVMSVSLNKTNALLEKLESRLTADATRSLVDMIKAQGPGCRAESVWQSLKDSKNMVSAISNFVEALQDKEASPATLRARAGELRALNCTIPVQVNNVLCQRTLGAMLEEEKFTEIMDFLDPNQKDKFPDDGISCVLPADMSPDALKLIVREFQSGCLSHLVNQCFLLEGNAPAPAGYLGKHVRLFTVDMESYKLLQPLL